MRVACPELVAGRSALPWSNQFEPDLAPGNCGGPIKRIETHLGLSGIQHTVKLPARGFHAKGHFDLANTRLLRCHA